MSQPTTIRILIVDDHPVVRFGLAAIIASQPDMQVVAQAGSGEDALRLARENPPDVVLIDLRLPGMSGVEVIQGLLREHSPARFVVLTTYEGDEDIHRALAAGAQAYLLKGMTHDELLNAIRLVKAGLRYIPPAVSKVLSERPPTTGMSSRELEVLRLIVGGLSNKEIGEQLGIAESTVKWYINILLSRLNVSDRTQAAVKALQRGIVHM